MWEQLNRITKKNGAIVLFGSEPFSSALRISNIKNYKYDWIWVKNRPSGALIAKYQPMRANENLLVFSIGGKVNYYPQMTKRTLKELSRFNKKTTLTAGSNIDGRSYGKAKSREDAKYKYPKNVLLDFKTVSNSSKEKTIHPTQKPVALMEYLIKTYTNENETVLDFTMGSGTTGVSCRKLNRNFIGIELDKTYFEIAKERIKNVRMGRK